MSWNDQEKPSILYGVLCSGIPVRFVMFVPKIRAPGAYPFTRLWLEVVHQDGQRVGIDAGKAPQNNNGLPYAILLALGDQGEDSTGMCQAPQL